MNSHNLFGTVIYVIFVLAISSAAVLGQNDPPAYNLLTDNGEDSPPFSEMAVEQSQGAVCPNAGRIQSYCSARWTASAEFIILERIGTFPYTLVSMVPVHTGPSTEVLNATDLHQGFAGGPRLSLIHHGDGDGDLEFSYFQIDGWHSYRSIGPTPDDWLVMTAPGDFVQRQDSPLHLNEQMMAWGYTSRLYNAELNVRWEPWRRVTALAGFRWVNVTEEIQGILAPPGTDGAGTFWDTQTKNNLYGVQIGADAKLLERGRFSINGLLKAGIFDNHAEEQTSVRMARIQFGASDSTDHLAFLGQLGVQCKYQVTRRLSLKAGYEAMWVEGVALAPGQIPETYSHYSLIPQEISVQALGVNCSSGIVYHGATAGLEYAF